MQKCKWTPGPWKITNAYSTTRNLLFYEIRAKDKIICNTWAEPHIGNARLIAAAPEMLNMLLERYKIVACKIADAVNEKFGYSPPDDWFDILLEERHKLTTIIESATGMKIEDIIK